MAYEYLTDAEKQQVINFNENELMREAVRKVMLEEVYQYGILEKGKPANNLNWAYSLGGDINNATMSEEELGKLLKVTVQAFSVVERAFNKIDGFITPVKQEEVDENPAK